MTRIILILFICFSNSLAHPQAIVLQEEKQYAISSEVEYSTKERIDSTDGRLVYLEFNGNEIKVDRCIRYDFVISKYRPVKCPDGNPMCLIDHHGWTDTINGTQYVTIDKHGDRILVHKSLIIKFIEPVPRLIGKG